MNIRVDQRLQTLINRDIKLELRERQLAKIINNTVWEFEILSKEFHGKFKELDEFKEMENIQKEASDSLRKILEEKEVEIIRMKQQIKRMSKKNRKLSEDLQIDYKLCESDSLCAHTKRIKLAILHQCTHLYVDASSPAHVVRGFANNQHKVIPFELSEDELSPNEIQQTLWQHVGECSNHLAEWGRLFEVKDENIDRKMEGNTLEQVNTVSSTINTESDESDLG